MKFKITVIGLFVFSIFAMKIQGENIKNDLPAVEQHFIDDPNEPHRKIEFFTLRPQGNGPFPVMFLLHGYQRPENSTGGEQLVQGGYLATFAKEGMLAVSISIPGHGHSEGTRDFSGPKSQKAIAAVIDYFAELPDVDPQRMGIYGGGKGATLASMVHKYTPQLALQILEGGWYDFTTFFSLLPEYLDGIFMNLVAEAGSLRKNLIERSAVYNTEYIHSKTLILLGEFDDRRTRPSSVALHKKLRAEGKDSKIKVFSNELHVLSNAKWEAIIPFIREHFFHLVGIGINASLIMPAIQISKVLPCSPAALSGKIHVGDVILSISPNNDENEIDTLRMPVHQFVSLMLGEKGTSVRLHIQHFDQTYEDVVIERG